MAAVATIPDEEKDHYKVAVNACEPDMLPKFRADSLPLQFAEVGGWGGVPHHRGLQVFRTFIRSPTVEKLLGETAKSVLNGDKAVSVKLAGEVIPSL